MLAAGLATAGCGKKAAGGGGAPPGGFAAQVIAVEAQRQPVSETLSIVGTIAANEMVELKSEIDGTIEEIRFQEGQPVKKGGLLVRLDETRFAASLAQAEANWHLSETTFKRNQQLLADKLIPQQEFDQSASTYTVNLRVVDWMKRQLQDARIHAPFDGVIGSRLVSPGQVIGKNTTLAWLVDLDPVKVEVNVPERFLSQLQAGQNLELRVSTYGDRPFTGKVFFIAPSVDPATRTALVKAQIPNPKHELKPGMFGNLDLTLQIRDRAVVIPEAALSQVLDGDRAMIYIVTATNTAQLVPIKLGVRLAGRVEVTEGLRGGEKVIVEGLQKIGPGAKVNVAAPEPAPAAPATAGR